MFPLGHLWVNFQIPENSHELNLAILDGKFNFEGQIWENISDQAKDLIKNLLAVHPHERLSLEDALSEHKLKETLFFRA